jgi:hypothetical protein
LAKMRSGSLLTAVPAVSVEKAGILAKVARGCLGCLIKRVKAY